MFSDKPPSKVSSKSCLIHGIGGVGKSQVALEYAHRYGVHYHYRFWVRAETEPLIAQDMARIMSTLGLQETAGPSAIADAMQVWFTKTTGQTLSLLGLVARGI